MRRPSDPDPNGVTRFRDWCVECDEPIKIGQQVSFVMGTDGDRDYLHHTCALKRLTTATEELNDVLRRLNTLLQEKREESSHE